MKLQHNPDGGDGGGTATLMSGGDAPPADTSTGATGDTTVVDPYYKGWLAEDGKFQSKDWTNNLPEHLKGFSGTFGKYDGIDSLLGGMANLQKLATGKSLEPLPQDASEEMKTERQMLIRKALGVPEDAAGYQITRPEDVPEEAWSDEKMAKYSEVLHKHNAPPDLVRELVALNNAETMAAVQGEEATRAANLTAEADKLKAEWGADYATKMEAATRAAATLGLDTADEAFNHSSVVMAMAKVTELVSENKLVSGDNDANYGQSDREKSLDIMKNPANPLYDAFHDPGNPMHDHAVKTKSEFTQRWHAQQGRRPV